MDGKLIEYSLPLHDVGFSSSLGFSVSDGIVVRPEYAPRFVKALRHAV
jgi:hypothetical protein